MSNENLNIKEEQNGVIAFANEVVATIAGLAAVDIPGIAGMYGGFASGVVELLGKKNLTKGVKVEVEGDFVKVDLYVVAEYGVEIPVVCNKVQESVKNALETMTGLSVSAVNIYVEGVKIIEAKDEK